jgi:hypothetical protein
LESGAAGGQESPVSPQLDLQQWRDRVLVDDRIFFFRENRLPIQSPKFFDLATARVKQATTLEKPGGWITVSTDGKFVLYRQLDHGKSNIMLLDELPVRGGSQSPA